jgi:MYXO-CTERM domain-containing protein
MIRSRDLLAASVLCGLLLPAIGHAEDCTSNLMIVLDRSCSMTSNMISGKTRWDIAVDAINKLITKNTGKLRFGLAMFPNKTATSPKCVQNSPLLAPAAGNDQTVSTQLTNNRPGSPCITNIDEGIKQANLEPSLFTADRRSFVLLITDGEQSNNCNGGTTTADPLTNQYIKDMYDKKVPTYVVGFDIGADVQAQTSLNSFAVSGGLQNTAGTTKYYAANNQAELEATLDQLAGLTSGEISVCRGMPCPDGRCLSATATCMSGFCVEPVPDDGGTGGTDDAGSDNGGSVATGCACQLGGQTAASSAGFSTFALAAALLIRRRRKSYL